MFNLCLLIQLFIFYKKKKHFLLHSKFLTKFKTNYQKKEKQPFNNQFNFNSLKASKSFSNYF